MPPDARERRALSARYDALLALITGRPGDDAASPDAGGAGSLVVGDARATADQRVHVYAHMYRARIGEALAAQFPRLARWLGADAFDDLAFNYVTDRPSRHPSLRFLGQALPDWLAGRAPAEEHHPARADLARLEWARADVFDAADETPLAIDAVRAWPADRFAELPLRLIGAHRLLSAAHPVAALWDALGAGAGAAASASRADLNAVGDAAANPRAESLLVWRQGINVFHRPVDDAERAALATITAGTTFGALCDGLLEQRTDDEATAQAFAWLSTWTADELLVGPPSRTSGSIRG